MGGVVATPFSLKLEKSIEISKERNISSEKKDNNLLINW